MKAKGIKRTVSYYKRMLSGNTLEVYYRKGKNEVFSEEFVGNGYVDFSNENDVIVIGFYRKGRNELNMEILNEDLEKALIEATTGVMLW